MVKHTFEGIQRLSSLCDPHGVNCYQRSQFQAERFLGHLPSTGMTHATVNFTCGSELIWIINVAALSFVAAIEASESGHHRKDAVHIVLAKE